MPGRSGHGLGLAIARQIVDQHHGRIEAHNRPEGGLCLTVVLPLVRAAA
jgi:signal transduction histidine kinase